jgi:hypothetical protein
MYSPTPEQSTGELLRELPDKIDHLASKTSGLGAGISDARQAVEALCW